MSYIESALNRHQKPQVAHHLSELSPKLLESMRAPKKLKDFSTTRRTSKLWILPDGTTQPLNQCHWRWMLSHPELAKKFKIHPQALKFNEVRGRVVALQRGFVRINYERSGGRLTIEGLRKFWTAKIKDSVFMLVLDNAKAIDHIAVYLFDESVKRVVASGEASLFRYNAQEKLDHIPLVSESARGKALRIVARDCRGSQPKRLGTRMGS